MIRSFSKSDSAHKNRFIEAEQIPKHPRKYGFSIDSQKGHVFKFPNCGVLFIIGLNSPTFFPANLKPTI